MMVPVTLYGAALWGNDSFDNYYTISVGYGLNEIQRSVHSGCEVELTVTSQDDAYRAAEFTPPTTTTRAFCIGAEPTAVGEGEPPADSA